MHRITNERTNDITRAMRIQKETNIKHVHVARADLSSDCVSGTENGSVRDKNMSYVNKRTVISIRIHVIREKGEALVMILRRMRMPAPNKSERKGTGGAQGDQAQCARLGARMYRRFRSISRGIYHTRTRLHSSARVYSLRQKDATRRITGGTEMAANERKRNRCHSRGSDSRRRIFRFMNLDK